MQGYHNSFHLKANKNQVDHLKVIFMSFFPWVLHTENVLQYFSPTLFLGAAFSHGAQLENPPLWISAKTDLNHRREHHNSWKEDKKEEKRPLFFNSNQYWMSTHFQSPSEMVPFGHPLQSLLQKLGTIQQTTLNILLPQTGTVCINTSRALESGT